VDKESRQLPFRYEDFYNGGMMAEEINKAGKIILKK